MAALTLQTFWQGEDAWHSAALLLLALTVGCAVFVLIWLKGLLTKRLSRALRESLGLVALFILSSVAGNSLRKADLRPTKERVEALAGAIAEHQRSHGKLPDSLNVIEGSLPHSSHKLHEISYKPRPDGTYTLFFQPSWYRHEYFPGTRSWVMTD